MNLGMAIRAKRRSLDLTQSQLAELVGCHRVRICEWENGDTAGIEARSLAALEKALQFSPGDLLRAYYQDQNKENAE